MEIITVWGSSKNLGGRINMEQKLKHRKELVLSATFVGLVCGLVLTHQQAYAAQTLPVNNQESQITAVAAPENNLSKTAAVNQDYSAENISNSAASGNVTTSTYSSLNNNEIAKQETAVSDSTNAASTVNTSATVPATNGINTSSAAEKNQPVNTMTSSSNQDTNNTTVVNPAAVSDNQINDNSTNTAAASEQPETNIIAQGTWGTSKWDYTQEGDDYILHLHAGTLGTPVRYNGLNGVTWDAGIGSLNTAFQQQLTQIIIDPGVIANQDSHDLFNQLVYLKTIQGLENLDTSQVTNMSSMFYGCSDLTNLDLSHFDTSQVTDMDYMFTGCEKLTSLDVSHLDTSQVTNMYEMFAGCERLTNLDVSHFNTSQVTDMSEMFWVCGGLTNLNVSHWDTSQVTNMSAMFASCENLTSLDVSHFDTSQVTNMSAMFRYCENLSSLDVSHFNTSQVTDMSDMFKECEYLTNLDVSHFNTSQVTDMSHMFYDCSSLTNLDLSHFDTSQVTDMDYMFAGCKNLTSLDLSNFDTSQLVNSLWIDFSMLEDCNNLHHLVLGPKTKLIDQNGEDSALPAVPAAGTKIPGTDKTVTAPYWVATSGYQQGQRYTSKELEQLTGRDQVTTYDWDSQPLFASTVATKAVIRTINVHNPDGTMQTENQIATLTQEIKNNADGTQTLGPWSTGQWQAYAVPEITGYTADPTEVAAQTVTDSTVNQTIDVYYEPVVQQITVNYLENGKIVGTQILTGYAGETIIPQYRAPKGYEIIDRPQGELTFSTDKQQIVQIPVQAQIIPTSESKVLIRTVNIHLPSGNLKTYRQSVVLTRTVYLNAVSGEKTYDDWSTGHWGAITVPVMAGYTASQAQVAAQTVTAQDSDQLLDIYYTKA